MLRDVLCRGLEDTEIQMDLLGDKNQDKQVVETKEPQATNQQLISEAEDPPAAPVKNQHILWHQGPWKKPSN